MPTGIGWTAAKTIGIGGVILFAFNFLANTTFWSIAWLLDDDYKKGGYHLLPTTEGKNRTTNYAKYTLLVLFNCSVCLPYALGITKNILLIISFNYRILFSYKGIQ